MYVFSVLFGVDFIALTFSVYVDLIDKRTKEIRQDDDQTVYKSLEEIADDLPDHSPRFVLLSYPLTLVCFLSPLTAALDCHYSSAFKSL